MSTKGIFTLMINAGPQDAIMTANNLLHSRIDRIQKDKIDENMLPYYKDLSIISTGLDNVQKELDQIRLKNGYTNEQLTYIDDMAVPTSASPDDQRRLYNGLINNKKTIEDWQFYKNAKQGLLDKKARLDQQIKTERVKFAAGGGKNLVTLADIEKTHNNYLYKSFRPYVATGYEYSTQDPVGANMAWDQTLLFDLKNIGDFINDQVIHFRLEGLANIDPTDRVRYCNMLGHRIMEKVSFKFSGAVIDSYTYERYNSYYNFELPLNKRDGWLRNIGQDVPTYGSLVSDVVNFDFSEVRWISDGPQTLKVSHDAVDVFIPLLFWFNRELGSSLPNAAIPQGQTQIEVKLANYDKICASDNKSGTGVDNFVKPRITIARLYSNQIYVNPEVRDMLLANINFTLIRVHRQFSKTIDKESDKIWLSEMKYPVEHMYVCFKPTINETGVNRMDLWNKASAQVLDQKPTSGIVITSAPGVTPVTYAPVAAFIRHYKETPSVNQISMDIYGVQMYDKVPAKFLSSYSSWRFGENICTPTDPGYYFINFDMLPGQHNPSGHLNFSQGREVFLTYYGGVFTSTNTGKFDVCAQCINFLVAKNNTINLKYAT